MNEGRTNGTARHAARVAVWVVGLVLALAVGAPWLLYDAPPSPEAAFVAKLCCVKTSNAAAPVPAPKIAPAR